MDQDRCRLWNGAGNACAAGQPHGVRSACHTETLRSVGVDTVFLLRVARRFSIRAIINSSAGTD